MSNYATILEIEAFAADNGPLEFLDCDDTGVTLKLDGDLTDSALSLDFLELSIPSCLKVGMLIKLDDEYVRIGKLPVYTAPGSPDPLLGTAGTVEITRGHYGTTPAEHDDELLLSYRDLTKRSLQNKATLRIVKHLGVGTPNDLYLEGDEDLKSAEISETLFLFVNSDIMAIAERIALISAGEYEDKTIRVEYPNNNPLGPYTEIFISNALELNGDEPANVFNRG